MNGHDYGLSLMAADSRTSTVDEQQRRRAMLVIASRAVDADDCRRLLEVLGLHLRTGAVG